MHFVIADNKYFRSGDFINNIQQGQSPIFLDPSSSEKHKGNVSLLIPPFQFENKDPSNFNDHADCFTPTNSYYPVDILFPEQHKSLINPCNSEETYLPSDSCYPDINSVGNKNWDWLSKFPKKFSVGFRTSGSSGEPRVYFKTQNEIFSELTKLRGLIHSKEPFLVSIPLCHIYGFLWGYMLPLTLNIRTIDSKNLSETIKTLSNEKIGTWITIPSQIQSLLELDISKIKPKLSDCLVISSGSILQPIIAKNFEELYSTIIIEIYGSTETGGIGYRYPAKEIGFKLFDSVRIHNLDGRVEISSPHIFTELKNPEGYFQLPDRVEYQNERLIFQGRLDRIVKRNSKRIHLDSLEKEIESHLGSESCIVVEYLPGKIGILLDKSKLNSSTNEIYNILETNFSRQFFPDKITLYPSLPKTNSGKKDYGNAKQLILNDTN